MLDLNITLVFQLFNFIVAIFILNILLIRPVREIIKKRDALMSSLAGEADSFQSEAEQKLSDYEAKLAAARQEAGKTREEGKSAGLEELRSIVGGAQQSARELLDENRARLNSQADDALAQLRDGIDNFSAKMGRKLMGEN